MPSVWDGVIGQARAVERLRASAAHPVHAYMLVGPPGSTKDVAARAFAAQLLAGVDDPLHRDARLAMAGDHPDVRETRRIGAAISAEQIDEIVRSTALSPVEGTRKIMILDEFHLLTAQGAARLLKTLEEPPESTMFIVLADHVSSDLVTIASRCVRIEFAAIAHSTIVDQLVAEGAAPEQAEVIATASAGNLDRARVLVNDPGIARRHDAFASIPRRLDGTGATVASLCDEMGRLADSSASSLAHVHTAEIESLEARVTATGERGSGRKLLEDRHKREVRRYRIDELRSGLAVIAGAYRDALVAGSAPRPESLARAVTRIHDALEALERNPNEPLLLQALLLDLPSL